DRAARIFNSLPFRILFAQWLPGVRPPALASELLPLDVVKDLLKLNPDRAPILDAVLDAGERLIQLLLAVNCDREIHLKPDSATNSIALHRNRHAFNAQEVQHEGSKEQMPSIHLCPEAISPRESPIAVVCRRHPEERAAKGRNSTVEEIVTELRATAVNIDL